MKKILLLSFAAVVLLAIPLALSATSKQYVQNLGPENLVKANDQIYGDDAKALQLMGVTLIQGSASGSQVIKSDPAVSIYSVNVPDNVYLCATDHGTSPAYIAGSNTASCLAKGPGYYDAILISSGSEKYEVTLGEYIDGKTVNVYLQGTKIGNSFQLSDISDDTAGGCTTVSGRTVCVSITGDEQSDISLDADKMFVSLKGSIQGAGISTTVSEALSKLDKAFITQIFK